MSVNYSEYMQSKHWRNTKIAKFTEVEYKCEKCGRADGKLDVHHLTYDRLGNERMSDLQVLCRYCHMVAHGEITFHENEGGDPNEPF